MKKPSILTLGVIFTLFILTLVPFSVADDSDGGSSPDSPSGDDGGSSPDSPFGDDGGSSPDSPSGDDGGGSSPDVPSGDDEGGTSPDVPSGTEGGDGGDGGGDGGVGTTPAPAPVPIPGQAPFVITPTSKAAAPVRVEVPSLPLTDLEIRLQAPLFMRLSPMPPDDDCLRAGESAILPVSLHNVGTTTLKDVRFMAAVPELGMVSAAGPMKLTKDAKSTLFFTVDVPADAAAGEYYLAFVASNGRFGDVVYRPFSVGRTC